MIQVQKNSVLLQLVQKPRMAEPEFGDESMVVSSTPIQVNAVAVLEEPAPPPQASQARSAAGASVPPSGGGGFRTAAVGGVAPPATAAAAKGWVLGWIQLQTSEVNWAYYEGRDLGSGSTLMRYDQEPARKPAVCRDGSFEGEIWYRAAKSENKDLSLFEVTGTERLPLQMSAVHGDQPSVEFVLEHENTASQAVNFLRVCDMKFQFLTVLALKSYERRYEPTYTFLKHFEWTVGGRYTVIPPTTPQGAWKARLETRDLGHVSGFRDGPPKAEYIKDLTAPMSPHCNTEAKLATQRMKPQESRARTGPPK